MQISMEEAVSQKSHKSCQSEQKMNISQDAREMVGVIAGPRAWQDTRERWLERAARALGFTYQRTRAIFYCRARIISAEEWITLNQRVEALKAAERRHQGEMDELRMARGASGPLGPVAR